MEDNKLLNPVSSRTEEIRAQNELHDIVNSSQEVLMAASTVFPFDLFPDRLTVDRTQITITHRSFFFMGDVISVRIEDILSITAHAGPFFGSIHMTTRFYHSDKLYSVNWLMRHEALRLKAIIQGLVIACSREVDLTDLKMPKLADELMRLGESSLNEAP